MESFDLFIYFLSLTSSSIGSGVWLLPLLSATLAIISGCVGSVGSGDALVTGAAAGDTWGRLEQ